MTTKDWLNRGWALDREITALESAKRRAYDRCVSGVASVSGAPGGCGGLSRYADFAAQVDAQIDKLIDIKQEIADVIAQVPDSSLRALLVRRYMNFEKWEVIAVCLNYSRRQVTRRHGQALKEVGRILAENDVL